MVSLANVTMAEAQKAESTAVKLEAHAENKKDLGRIQSDLAKTQIRKVVKVEIIDRAKIDFKALGAFFTDDAILAALRAFASTCGREIGAGARIYEDEVVSVR